MNEVQTLHVRISRATEVVWEGSALAVSSANADGPFDILPMHANFLTLIQGQQITVSEVDGSKKHYDFAQAVIYVKDNKVKIYTDIA